MWAELFVRVSEFSLTQKQSEKSEQVIRHTA